jgi:alanine racemase
MGGWAAMNATPRAEAVIDLEAIRDNVRLLRARVVGRSVMAVVKADGYGHGILQSAAAARAGGADWLGVAVMEEALALRAAGDTGPILSWLAAPGEDYRLALKADVEVSAYSVAQLTEILAAARDSGQLARVQLKVDSGLSRGGARLDEWPALVHAARRAERAGWVEVTGIWSHFACSDEPEHPSVARQEEVFRAALDIAAEAGLKPRLRHLANSAAVLTRESAWFDMVRVGLAGYGLSPIPALAGHAELGLRPAMTVRAQVALTKRLAAGDGVAYGHTHVVERDTDIALIPVGYGDGIPRHASNRAPVWVDGRRYRIAGRVSMDQFAVATGDDQVKPGRTAILFGTGEGGVPTAQDWAEAADTIAYEIVTRIGGRIPRRYVGSLAR